MRFLLLADDLLLFSCCPTLSTLPFSELDGPDLLLELPENSCRNSSSLDPAISYDRRLVPSCYSVVPWLQLP